MKKLLLHISLFFSLIGFSQNEQLAQYYYDKGDFEKAKIIYEDLLRSSPSNTQYFLRTIDCYQQLQQFDVALQSFGDKNIIQEMIVKNLINRGGTQIPSDNAMRGDLPAFVEQTYLRIYNRKPNEFEAWKLKDMIEKNADITAKLVYYSLMTSEEYKYY